MIYFLIGLVIFVVDRITKQYALTHWSEYSYDIHEYLSFTLVFNKGISWGIYFTNDAVASLMLLVSLSIFTACISWYAYQHAQKYALLGYTMICAGSASNIIDRIVYPGVIDFIALSWDGYTFPVFNVADIAIVMGVLIVFIYSYRVDT